MSQPMDEGLRLHHELGLALAVTYRDRPLLRYVYQPWDAQLESPRPYFHPVHTLGGDAVTLYRPHDHVWHKGIAWALPNVGSQSGPGGTQNFWGGVTFLRGPGYAQLPNNGTMAHREFEVLDSTPARVRVGHRLDWITQAGRRWFDEARTFAVTVHDGCWVLAFATGMTNVSDHEIVIGSPTTEGRENAGYGGLFWRGPRSFTGGRIYAPGITGADDLMGVRAPWLGFCGHHDEHGRASTVVFVDAPENPGHPTQWFARSELYACGGPAPFFAEAVPVPPGGRVAFRYAVVVADGDAGSDGAEQLAAAGLAALSTLELPVQEGTP